jgi:sodium/potassium-transporting ATPase subunit alpha
MVGGAASNKGRVFSGAWHVISNFTPPPKPHHPPTPPQQNITDNLKKTIAYTLTHAAPEVLPLFLNLVLNMPLGLGGLLILTIDLLTEQGPAISLAYEHAEANVMERPPRDLGEDRLIDGPLIRYAYLIAGMTEVKGVVLVCV